MFGIKYETWKSTCDMYFSLKLGSLKSYLQWFPFTKLTEKDKDYISSDVFYSKYIKTGSFVLFIPAMHQSENFIQKGDGSFRDSSLISPILYLVLQSIGKEIYDHYISERPLDISVYYAGNYEYMRPKYKQDYDDFFKELNACKEEYQYFIKTDITSFFSNISIDKLISRIDNICNKSGVVFTQTQLHLFKELLAYCGNGRFPLIENSVASSFLATVIYLDTIDEKLHKYISENIAVFSNFHMVRYVDDMYILISSNKPFEALYETYNEIRNEYSSILKEYGLALNTKKCCFEKMTEINEELKKSLYDEYFNGQKHDIEELFNGSLQKFLSDLYFELLYDCVDVEKYNELINKYFSSSDIEFTANEVFNYFVYENDTELCSEPVKKELRNLVTESISFINLDPKRLTAMIMKTKEDKAIKIFLNHLFIKHRENKWNSYNTTVAITYLIQSGFKHVDLLDILCEQCPILYAYYFYNCQNSFLNYMNNIKINKIVKTIGQDYKTFYLYFMYLSEAKRENHMASFAYYKNYFDRITAIFEFVFDRQPDDKRPNYKKFYQERTLKQFYKNIENSNEIIKKAQNLRNSNPISHASSGLLDNKNTTDELNKSVSELSGLIVEYLKDH
ncbi:MAG: AbiA family abortive infection protein [Oscillospiraceae bacterium]|nr:AbiA family abortive infection protein [Oscillospiraceae bacterium]